MQVVWEADTAAFANRKRAARACIPCQKKKKRCHHTFTRPPDQQAETDGLDRVLPNLTHKEPVRFVGDLNPESILTDLSSRSKGSSRLSRIGTFVEQVKAPPGDLQIQYAESLAMKNGEKVPNNVEKYGKGEGGRRTLTAHHRNYLQAVGAFRVLPKPCQDAMVTTYIACIHGLLPILDGTKLLRDYTSGNCSLFLVQAICLVTCKIPEVSQFLRLFEGGPLLDPIPFARSLHTGLDAAMKADLEPDRMTKVQILTLMHLHNDGPGGIEESSQHLSQAIHDGWTAGLHIQTPGRTTRDEASLLWWTLWCLDRINACIGGRPCMIADRDIDIGRPPLDANKHAPISVWIRLGDLLDQVIEFYRPTANPDSSGWEAEFPAWNAMIEGIDLEETNNSYLIVLELCYNVIAILSCRNASSKHASYTRRIHAATRIEHLLANPLEPHPDVPAPLSVSPIPLVPYAISLSLTVAYRGLRDHSSDTDATASALAARCAMLESLSGRWWTADAMAKLGRKALKSLLNPVGLRRREVEDLESAMEAEVTVCKYGPFEGRGQRNGGEEAGDGEGNGGARGGGLHLLSDAAAAHAQTQTPSTTSHLTTTSNTLPSMSAHSQFSPTTTTGSSYRHTSPTDSLPTPNPLPQPALHANPTQQHPTMSNSDPTLVAPTPGALDPTPVFDKFDNTFPHSTTADSSNNGLFTDLDNLFDGFFDLSMPTVTFDDGSMPWGEWYGVGVGDGVGGGDGMGLGMGATMGMGMNINMNMGSGVGGVGGVGIGSGGGMGGGGGVGMGMHEDGIANINRQGSAQGLGQTHGQGQWGGMSNESETDGVGSGGGGGVDEGMGSDYPEIS